MPNQAENRKSPCFSVLIVNYNSAHVLPAALKSLAAQRYSDFEVLVLDNNGDDRPAFEALAKAEYSFPIRFELADCNLGFAAGMNRLAKLAQGEWLATLNPDARADPDWLAAAKVEIDAGYDGDMLASLQLDAGDPNILDGAGDRYSIYGLAWRAGHGQRRESFVLPDDVFSPCGAAAFYHRDRFLELGGYCERFFCYLEDVDLGFRMRRTGGRCKLLKDAIVLHEGGVSSGGKNSDFAVEQGMRNLINLAVRCMPLPWLLFSILFAPLTLGLLLVRHMSRGQGGAALKGLCCGLKDVPAAKAERRMLVSGQKDADNNVRNAVFCNPLHVLWRQ